MGSTRVAPRDRATRLFRLVATAGLIALLFATIVEVVPPAATVTSTYVLITKCPAGAGTFEDSVELFRGLAESGYDVGVVRYFGGIGVGGVFNATDEVASRIEGRLRPLLFLKSNPVSLGTDSFLSGQAADGFDYFPGGNVTGAGIKVAVIDTGVDYNHPALGGSMGVKVVGGYNFVDGDYDLSDDDGHGTAVAGIIAGNSSSFKGVSPGAQLLVYKVFSRGETTTTLIVEALDQAVKDGAKVVNLSLGGGFAASSLNSLSQLLYSRGIELVAAIGNDGPDPASAEAPGDLEYFYSVGASVSLSTTDPQAEVEIGGNPLLTAMPVNDTPLSNGVISAPTEFIENGRASQLAGLDLSGRIAVTLRDHRTLFSTMEQNAADAGALALIIVNDSPLSFTANGTTGGPALVSNETSYRPRIPVVAVSGAEGDSIASSSGDGTNVSLAVFEPTSILYPATFSSLGPADDFTIKPEVLAPGDNVVVPEVGTSGYVEASGTSFAAPQVSGAFALLAQLHPDLTTEEAFSMVSLGASVAKGYFGVFPLEVQGAGVLNVSRTLSLPFALDLHYALLYPSTDHPYSESFEVDNFGGGSMGPLSYQGSYPLTVSAAGSSAFTVTASPSSSLGEGEDWLNLTWAGTSYSLPVRVIPGNLWVGYDGASGQLYSTYRGSIDALVTVVRPDGSVLYGTMASSHNFSLAPDIAGFYRVTVEAQTGGGAQVGRLVVFSSAGLSRGVEGSSDTFPGFVPLGVVVFSAMVVLLAAAAYSMEARALRIEGPRSARGS